MSEQEKIVMKKNEKTTKAVCQEDCCCCDHCVLPEEIDDCEVEVWGEALEAETDKTVNFYVFDSGDVGDVLRLVSSVALFISSVAILVKSLRKE